VQTAGTGDYVVIMTVGGQTYRQPLHVERVSGGAEEANPFGGEEERQPRAARR
jgi:hypothetical protein